MVRRSIHVLVLLAVGAVTLAAAPPPPPLTPQLVATLERTVRMPVGAYPLTAYGRYYAYSRIDGHELVHAVYLRGGIGMHSYGVHVVAEQDLPTIMDGGCSVIEAWFDPKAKRMAGIACHGVA